MYIHMCVCVYIYIYRERDINIYLVNDKVAFSRYVFPNELGLDERIDYLSRTIGFLVNFHIHLSLSLSIYIL